MAEVSEIGKAKKGSSEGEGASIWTIFVHADTADILLMGLGVLGALGDGLSLPAMLIVTSKLMNNLGETYNPSFSDVPTFIDAINKVSFVIKLRKLDLIFTDSCAEFIAFAVRGVGDCVCRFPRY